MDNSVSHFAVKSTISIMICVKSDNEKKIFYHNVSGWGNKRELHQTNTVPITSNNGKFRKKRGFLFFSCFFPMVNMDTSNDFYDLENFR